MKRNNWFSALVVSTLIVCNSQAKLIEATKEDDLKKGTVLAKFSATRCGACKNCKTPFNALSESYPNITFADIDIDKTRDWNSKYNIESLPTFILFENGKEVSRQVGYSEDKIKNALNSAKTSKAGTAKETTRETKKAEVKKEVPAAPETKTAPKKTQYSSY